jgi:mRNA interferase RelE/StbE
MPDYQILWDSEALADLQALPKQVAERIQQKVTHHLAKDPVALGKHLRGDLKHYYRYRIGDYRVVYEVREQEITIVVVRVGNRRDVYGGH